MKALVLTFDGPRSAEQIAASDRAGKERLGPEIMSHPRMREELVNMCALRRPDGGEVIVVTLRTTSGLTLLSDLVRTSTLLPGEDVSLLPGPDHVEVYDVIQAVGVVEPIGVGESVGSTDSRSTDSRSNEARTS